MGSLVELTKASKVARMGVLHGEATSAKVSPAEYACNRMHELDDSESCAVPSAMAWAMVPHLWPLSAVHPSGRKALHL